MWCKKADHTVAAQPQENEKALVNNETHNTSVRERLEEGAELFS